MIEYLIGIIIISIVISYFSKRNIVYIIPMCILSTIIILYTFSLLDAMVAGVYFIYAVGAIGFIFFVYTAIRYKKDFFKSISYTPIIIFIAFGALTLWAHNGRMVTLWDELSHWGRVVKDMYYYNALGTHPDSMVIFENYPPGIAMLQYLFVKIRGTFIEEELYYATNIFYFALMMPLFKGLTKKNVFKIIIIALIIIVLPTGFYKTAYLSLYVDALLGMLFAYILLTYFTNKFSTFTFINISLALFVLTITKNSGVGIAALALFVILVDFIFADRTKTKEYFKSSKLFYSIICILLPVIAIAVSKLSWSSYLSSTEASIAFDTSKITLQQVINVFARLNGSDAQNETMLNFLDAFTGAESSIPFANFNLSIAPITIIVIFIFLGAYLFYSSKDSITKKRILLSGISLLIGVAVYFFTLLCSYLFLFTEYEAMGLASYGRYISSYFLGVYIFIVGYIVLIKQDNEKSERKIPTFLLVFLILLSITGLEPFLSETILAPFSTYKTATNREPYEEISEIKNVVNPNEKVYFIHIGSNGYSFYVCDYITFPVRLKGLGSIGVSKYYEGDIWTRKISPEEWEEILLTEYDYVYVYKAEYDFGEHYGYLFGGADSITPMTLYSVEKQGSGAILQKVSE